MRNLFYASANEWINQRIIKHANAIYRLGGYQERVPNGEACATLSIDGVWSGIQQLIHQRPTTELRDETLDSVLPFRFHIRFDLIPNRPSLFLPPPPPPSSCQYAVGRSISRLNLLSLVVRPATDNWTWTCISSCWNAAQLFSIRGLHGPVLFALAPGRRLCLLFLPPQVGHTIATQTESFLNK
jgi:hypothetical protein